MGHLRSIEFPTDGQSHRKGRVVRRCKQLLQQWSRVAGTDQHGLARRSIVEVHGQLGLAEQLAKPDGLVVKPLSAQRGHTAQAGTAPLRADLRRHQRLRVFQQRQRFRRCDRPQRGTGGRGDLRIAVGEITAQIRHSAASLAARPTS